MGPDTVANANVQPILALLSANDRLMSKFINKKYTEVKCIV